MRRPLTVIVCASLIVTLAMGVRQTFGLFLPPISIELGIGRQSFGLAIAISNLLFGLAQPFVGAIADRHGAGRVVVAGTLLYVAGMVGAAQVGSAIGLHLTLGVMVGVAMAATTFVVVLGAVGRVVPAERRGLAFGIVTAGGSLGQFLLVPTAQVLLVEFGYRLALIALAGAVAICIALAAGVAGAPKPPGEKEPQLSLGEALKEAARHRGYWLLNAGFFVCGFQLVFIGTHFPAYLSDRGLGLEIGASALALIGLFNIFGSYLFGLSGDFWRRKYVLSGIYAGRAVVVALFLALPLSPVTALLFAGAMGFLWLGTVPLTSGLIGQIFGVRYLSTLYGIVFLSHQLGSFCGAWLGGYAFDRTGSYESVWIATFVLAAAAALIHLPIRDGPQLRPQPA
ncbi:MFS transporter [Sphingosinicella terrae]|uniref:MFS transporter n=1 Tax=Sphingosinicella terrae TaxID=2172047 RepID=UPI000E0D29E7|nr:MFS transporter [Sphingosinicella terrae]